MTQQHMELLNALLPLGKDYTLSSSFKHLFVDIEDIIREVGSLQKGRHFERK